MQNNRQTPGMLLLSLGGIGFASWRPALLASAASAVMLLALEAALPPVPEARWWAFGALFAAVFACSLLGLKRGVPKGDVDQPYVVIDEFLGMLVAMAPQLLEPGIAVLPAFFAFAVFRVIDSVKPLGIRLIDRRNTPVSVLLDDVAAGLCTALLIAGAASVLQMSATMSAS